MTEYVIEKPESASVPVVGTHKVFPVRRIYCVGRNYMAHIKEMGGDTRKPPFFFQKPADAIVQSGGAVPYPTLTDDLHHEIELVLAIGKGGTDISESAAAEHVFGLAVGIDLTRRDKQIEVREAGRPWEIGKAFDHSAPITPITPLNGALPIKGAISLSVNGEIRQKGDLSELIWSCDEIISVLSTHYRLAAGDLIYTGTPSGVRSVVAGDNIIGKVEGLPQLEISICKSA